MVSVENATRASGDTSRKPRTAFRNRPVSMLRDRETIRRVGNTLPPRGRSTRRRAHRPEVAETTFGGSDARSLRRGARPGAGRTRSRPKAARRWRMAWRGGETSSGSFSAGRRPGGRRRGPADEASGAARAGAIRCACSASRCVVRAIFNPDSRGDVVASRLGV